MKLLSNSNLSIPFNLLFKVILFWWGLVEVGGTSLWEKDVMKNYLEILRFSEQEMLDLWKLKMQLVPMRKNCIIEREDGIDIDQFLIMKIKKWYSHLLSDAPANWLPCKDISQELTVVLNDEMTGTVAIPSNCIRPIEWEMPEWGKRVTEFWDSHDYIALLQHNIYSRAGIEDPVAVLHVNEIKLYSCTSERLTRAICVIKPTAGQYELAEVALETIDEQINNF